MASYNHQDIESHWQADWEKKGLYKTPEQTTRQNKCYILPQLPYPSGSGLHMGHAEVYVGCDIAARFSRSIGKDVLQVVGWDSFGLPAENFAIKNNIHPRISTENAIDNFRTQIKSLGISVDWEREVGSHNPDYYKWTQWLFLLMHKQGLAYRKKQAINWCDTDKTVLANEQVEDGKCERCGTQVVQRDMEQWYLKITDYADRLYDDLDKVDWPSDIVKRQRNWIGRSEGAQVQFAVTAGKEPMTVFTTRPDTLFGVTFMVVAPESQYLKDWMASGVVTNADAVQGYIDETAKKTELDRQISQEKTGVLIEGVSAIHPITNEKIPVYAADYVLASYGTGAIMAVPAHDERDFDFAKKFGVAVKQVVAPYIELTGPEAPQEDKDQSCKDVVSAIIKQKDRDQYLLLKWTDTGTDVYGFVGGGLEDNETVKEAALRETIEEAGYSQAVSLDQTLPTIYGNGYKARKNINCFDKEDIVVLEVSGEPDTAVSEEEIHEVVWVKKDDVAEHLTKEHHKYIWQCYLEGEKAITDPGMIVNSDFLNGKTTDQAKEAMIAYLEEHNLGMRKKQFRLRDWSVSRQRFWGAPLPMLYDEQGNVHPVPEADLPVVLPDDVDFKPTGESPLNYSPSFQDGVEETYGKGWRRETDTLDTFMCSSWYYFRYLDPKNDQAFAGPEQLKQWMPVDFYLGGAEHVNGHMLYSRFITKVLFDAGYIDFDEPFLKHRNQGMILGDDNRKMSKRWGNVINPTDVVAEYGADAARMYLMFMGPLEQTKSWDTNGIKGVRRFLDRIMACANTLTDQETPASTKAIHAAIKKVSSDMPAMSYNTAIAAMMECVNVIMKEQMVTKADWEKFLGMLAPFAPHLAEELWHKLGHDTSITMQSWPSYDESLLVEDEVTIVVQVNGKVRAKLTVQADICESDITTKALADDNVKKWLEGKKPKKVIYIKGKLVSVVV